MKKSKTRAAVLLAFVLALALYVSAFAANGYDSTVDPLITLSYLNDVFMPQVREQVQTLIDGGGASSTVGSGAEALASIQDEILSLQNRLAALEEGGTGTSSGGSAAFLAIEVKQGQVIYATGTSCELVLRSGTATIVSPFENQGLSDFTDGVDLQNGASVPSNHLLLIPRANDGRGITVTSSSAWIMVRGEYKIGN